MSINETLLKSVEATKENPLGEEVIEMPQARKLFVVTFKIESEKLPPMPNGQERTMNVPAFVEDFTAAEAAAESYANKFADTPEGKQAPDAKLTLQSIVRGGTLLI